MKALHPLEEVRQYVYGDQADQYETYDARPIEAVIPVDFAIPGCPIDRDEFLACVKALLLGKKPPIPDYPLCVECKLKENTCLYTSGQDLPGPGHTGGLQSHLPELRAIVRGLPGILYHIPTTARCATCWPSTA